MQIVLQEMWVRHINRFSERMRGRLYAALIAYMTEGTEIPEKLMPYLGIILDLMAEANTPHPQSADKPPVDPLEQRFLDQFMDELADAYSNQYKVEPDKMNSIINGIFTHWQNPEQNGGRPVRHKDANEFFGRMSDSLDQELAARGYSDRRAERC